MNKIIRAETFGNHSVHCIHLTNQSQKHCMRQNNFSFFSHKVILYKKAKKNAVFQLVVYGDETDKSVHYSSVSRKISRFIWQNAFIYFYSKQLVIQ